MESGINLSDLLYQSIESAQQKKPLNQKTQGTSGEKRKSESAEWKPNVVPDSSDNKKRISSEQRSLGAIPKNFLKDVCYERQDSGLSLSRTNPSERQEHRASVPRDGPGGRLERRPFPGNKQGRPSLQENGPSLQENGPSLQENGPSFQVNGPKSRGNGRRGRGNSKPLRNMEKPEHKAYYNSEKTWNTSSPINFSDQQPSKPSDQLVIDRKVLESVGQKRGKPPRPEGDDVRGFRYMQIKELLKKEPSDLLMHLTINKDDFLLLLKQSLRPDMVMLVAEMFARISSSNMRENLAALLAQSVQPNLLEQFSELSFNIVAQNMKYNTGDLMKYFKNLYTLYQDVVDIMPSKASEILKDHSTRAVMALNNLKTLRKVSVSAELEENYGILMASVESLHEQSKVAPRKKFKDKVMREWQPGIDFRLLSIHPLPQDLLSNSDVTLSPVVVNGPYKNVEHYLDVQFNLMREDFLIPLRDGIANFVEQKSSKSGKFKRIENVRFYHGVRFLNQFIESDVLITEVLFNPRAKSSNQNWERSKRLLYGSLLCFTSDNFKSIILGVVCERRVEHLKKGILRCELIGDVRDEGLFSKEFVMAENEVYFEAYQHVMRALQNFNDVNFPLREYIVNVTPDLHLPTYLGNNPYCFYKYEGYEFPVVDEHFWPPKEILKVNDSQFMSLHSALTKKCAVIQGPPGTGKTYLGLLIAKLLLENAAHWRNGRNGPILVVCFTNHALDQFLEGMLSFTENIVRIGNQSKNEKLNDYNLKVVRKRRGIRGMALHGIEADLERCAHLMSCDNDILKECMKNVGIFSLQYFWHWMEPQHVSWFTINGSLKDSMLVEWLLSGAFFHKVVHTSASLDDLEPIPEHMTSMYALSLETFKADIDQLHADILEAQGYEEESLRNILMMYIGRFHYMRERLEEPFELDEDLIKNLSAVKNLNDLHPELRWVLYRYWLSRALDHYQGKLIEKRQEYQALNKQKSEILEAMYLDTIVDCDIVGMTTTGAARHQGMLQKLGSKIVIVEEAAEAMESHVVVCLSSKCEHLILIGDHKQLRPSPAVYKLAKDYNLEISLFERLLMNGIRFDTLRIQHRMRPDIADLVFPAVYPVLENHPSVLAYDSILGIRKNLFFITHTHPEETAMDDLSKRNPHEAAFLIALCRHIILQGYEPSQITILATYLGQMFLLKEEKDKHSIAKDVRIAVVDNFQGEENDIILLSLVRNNEERKIGFLASENRTCVSLSRAKKGLYVIGNMDMLAEKSSLWSQIRNVLQEKDAVGTHLTLQCLKHPDQLTEVSKAEDFNCITEGGCTRMCGERLNCGHICKKMCHVRGHTGYRCLEICNKEMCIRGHRCQKFCWQDCGDCLVPVDCTLPCGHAATLPCHLDPKEYECLEEVSAKLPDCEHTNRKLCHVKVEDVKCSFDCDSRLPCGHVCPKLCHVRFDPEHLEYKCLRPCGRKNLDCKDEHICQRKCHEVCGICMVKVKRKLPNCDHFFDMDCSTDPSNFECRKPCKKKLECGHDCPRKCMEPCGGCQKIVVKEIPDCNHKVKMKCCQVPERHMCKEKCSRIRICGHKCTNVCGIVCSTQNCESLSVRTARALCGHDVRLFCHETLSVPTAAVLMGRCRETCGKILQCSHRCKGTCGQCMQGRIHIPCQEKCGKNLICGHECTVSCSSSCPPCKKTCFVRCQHSKCKSKCGKPCSPCQENCGWRCEHHKCSKKCSQLCDRPPCNEPCKKKLKCNHDCLGFCGEMCPDLCKVCDPEKVDDILAFLATEDEENARFVVLPDCGHVFELTGLDRWLSMDESTVKMLECPQCKTPIQLAYRYGNNAKKRFSYVMQVKTKVFGNLRQINNKVIKSVEKLRQLTRSDEFKKSQSSLDELQHLVGRSKKAHLGAFALNSLEARTEFVLTIVEHFNEQKSKISVPGILKDCEKLVNLLIRRMLDRLEILSTQEHSDFEGECMRFHLLMSLRALESTIQFRSLSRTSWYQEYEKCRVVVEDARAFPKNRYSEIFQKINDVYKTLTSGPIGISKEEMRQVVAAVGLHQGHWYRCPNGHIFAIGECGQAMQTGMCNECGALIGGGSHRLLSTNTSLGGLPVGL